VVAVGRARGQGHGQNAKPHTGYYNANEWQNLTQEQHPPRGTKRNISSVDTNQSDTSVIMGMTLQTWQTAQTGANPSGETTAVGCNAGNQFGHRRSIGAMTSGPCCALNKTEINRITSQVQTMDEKDIPGFLELDSHVSPPALAETSLSQSLRRHVRSFPFIPSILHYNLCPLCKLGLPKSNA
jgi:hypothetical protein